MNRLSSRIKKYIEIAKKDIYTPDEYNILLGILKSIIQTGDLAIYNVHEALDDYLRQGYSEDSLDAHYTNSPEAYDDTRYYKLSFLQYVLTGSLGDKKIFIFLTQVPLCRVPLYINDPLLAPFAKWRLTIAR